LYHASPNSSFSALAAVGITATAWATLLAVGIGIALGGAPIELAIMAGQLCLLAVPVGIMRLQGRSIGALGIARPAWQHVVAGMLVGVSAWYVNIRLVSLLPLPREGVQVLEQVVDQMPLSSLLLSMVVLPAICEEILFRGVLLRGLASRFHPPIAILLAAMVFSLYHLNLVQLLPTLTLGLALGVIALRAGSSLPTMLAHALNNAIAVLVAREEMPALANRAGTGWLDQHPTLALAGATATTTAGIAIALIGPRAPVPEARP
jgi:membrane protease YdiL (CAAX protease family)